MKRRRKANVPLRIRNLIARVDRIELEQHHREEHIKTLQSMIENQRMQIMLAFDRLGGVTDKLGEAVKLLAERGHYKKKVSP